MNRIPHPICAVYLARCAQCRGIIDRIGDQAELKHTVALRVGDWILAGYTIERLSSIQADLLWDSGGCICAGGARVLPVDAEQPTALPPVEDILAGRRLETANRVLRWHGLPFLDEGTTLAELWQALASIELDRFCHVIGELTDALDESSRL